MKVAYIAVRGSALRRTLHNTHDMPYLFNGKERDEETGLYYYGARHIDAELCLWYGVDPLWMKYPDISPYVYCADNPIKFIDPNGAEFDDIVNSIKSGWEKVGQFGNKADQAVNKAASKIFGPAFGSGSEVNNPDIKMKGKTYGEWEGHADGNLSGGGEKDLPNYVAVSASIDLYEFASLGGDLNVGIYKIIRKDKEEGGTLYKHMRHRLKHRKRPAGEKIPIKNLVSIDKRPKLSIPKTVSEIGSLIRLSAKITGGRY